MGERSTIDNKKLYPGELETITGSTAFEILKTRYFDARPAHGDSSVALSKSGSITVTRATLTAGDSGVHQQNLASAWPKSRSNRWVFDLFSHDRLTAGDTILVPAQTTFGTISGLTAENDDKFEATIDLNPSLIPVRKAAVWCKVTDETVEDFNGFASWMNSELTRQLLSEIDDQLLNGNGVAPSLHGLLSNASLQSQSKGADTLTVAISKAIAKVLTAGFYPTAIVVSPDDFAALTAATPIDFNGTFFGVPLIASEHISNNLPVIGDFTAATVFERTALTFEMTNSDQEDFISNLTTVRAEQRLTLAVFSPKAFCKIVA
jgi:HK97 family phage major capsid protein